MKSSTTTKARLLHYFPPQTPSQSANGPGDESSEYEDNWCATHLDHGCLTGLTSAMYVDENNNSSPPSRNRHKDQPSFLPPLPELAPQAPDSGLYILSRTSTTTKIDFPADRLAFQTGEALQVITGGIFKAVPHFVRSSNQSGIARNTLAVFTRMFPIPFHSLFLSFSYCILVKSSWWSLSYYKKGEY